MHTSITPPSISNWKGEGALTHEPPKLSFLTRFFVFFLLILCLQLLETDFGYVNGFSLGITSSLRSHIVPTTCKGGAGSCAIASVTTLPNSAFSKPQWCRPMVSGVSEDVVPQNKINANEDGQPTKTDFVVVGGGPAGLLSAIMLAQKFPDQKVKVFERLSAPPSPTDEDVWSDVAKFYLVGLGGRGQNALDAFGVWDDVKACSIEVVGRMDWAPGAAPDEGVERIFTDRIVQTQVLPRDKLVGVSHKHITEKYPDRIELNYGFEVTPIDFHHEENTSVLISVSKCAEDDIRVNPTSRLKSDQNEPEKLCGVEDAFMISTKLLIAADGTARTVASKMETEDKAKRKSMRLIEKLRAGRPFTIKRYVDDNQRIYKTVPMKFPSSWRGDLNYSARTKDGRVVFDALPADSKGNYCGVLLLRKDDPIACEDSDPKELRKAFDDALPQFSAIIDDEIMETVAKKPPSFLPSFRYASPRLNQGDRTLILGDCAHTVKPYFGLGANSALEDAKILGEIIDSSPTLTDAVHSFSKKRAGEAEALVRISRELDRPGLLGFVTFILPIILDAIFHGFAPKIFAPNTISMLQRQGLDFRAVRRRKRMDRIAQIAVLGAVGTSLTAGTRALIGFLAKATGKTGTTVVTCMAASAAGLFIFRKAAFFLVLGLAPADVLAKTKSADKSAK